MRGRSRIADVSPMTTHETGAAAKVNKTEMMRPKLAWAYEAAVEVPHEAATPRAISRAVLTPVPHR